MTPSSSRPGKAATTARSGLHRRPESPALEGYFALVLHAHLPYVRHPEYEDFLEERWLYEAITETYLPLLEVFERLVSDGIPLRVSMSLTPTLASMLVDPLLQSRYVKHIERLILLAEREVQRTRWLPDFHGTARLYLEQFKECRRRFEEVYHRDLVGAFRAVAESSQLEIMTCAATHGFLPLLAVNPTAVRAQIRVAVQTHRRLLGRAPRGIWLPECGYTPGLDAMLAEEGLRFFLVDSHGLAGATPPAPRGVYGPVATPAGVAAFGRDMESSRSVWSADCGYPGDPEYRDFYRDIGFDLDLDYIRPFIHESGLRIATGIKYHRITGPTDAKQPYRPEEARRRVAAHAADFVDRRLRQAAALHRFLKQPPVVVSPYDAELFGHWWYEGPQFVDGVLRRLAESEGIVRTTTPMEVLERMGELPRAELSFSSWGHRGYGEVWLNESNEWIYRHLHKAADRMVAATRRHASATGLPKRILDQMARELLLAQASDWAFIMSGRTAVEYAVRRTNEHVARFTRLYEHVAGGPEIDEAYLTDLEGRDNLFPDIDFRVYAD